MLIVTVSMMQESNIFAYMLSAISQTAAIGLLPGLQLSHLSNRSYQKFTQQWHGY